MGRFSPHHDDDVDVLEYLEFSEPDYAGPQALPPPSPNDEFDMALLDAVDSTLLWEINNDDATTRVEPLVADNDYGGDGGTSGSRPPVGKTGELMAVSPAWAPATGLDCSCCHVLREVIHSDGQKNMKLALHGGLGFFYHAILDVYYNIDGFVPAMEQSYIDLSAQNLEWVKQFFLDYGLLRVRERYVMMQDSLSAFYDALCVPMSYEEETVVPEPGLCQSRPSELHCDGEVGKSKAGIATQRERTRRLHLKDVANYVHLPITEAAKELQICPTALKKVCRKHGMLRWPYRKIKSIDRTISNLQRELRSGTAEGATKVEARISRLVAERARICAGLPP
ncbi:hypothetical protein OPV22_013859 [Ensete ventricosum]|uniref:RWP-RK domain-containing protein n=1 Tax=Ensete ventricosum TaxID=4639 RepID=A0AAV8R1Y4_ENSVE|nr:hypothetical protein OPV22_013859 [Ensete ventricosum]